MAYVRKVETRALVGNELSWPAMLWAHLLTVCRLRGKPFEVKADTVAQLGGSEHGSQQAAGSRKTLPGGSLSVSSGCRKCFIDLLRFSTQGSLFPVHGTWPPKAGIMLAMEPGDSSFLLILAVTHSRRDQHFPGRCL